MGDDMKNGQDGEEHKEGSYEWLLELHRTGIPEEKKKLVDWLERYWERHKDEVKGSHDKKERIFRNLLFDKEQIKIEVMPRGKKEMDERDGVIWNEKKEVEFANAFFVIILTMRNRRYWWDEKEKAYAWRLPDNLRTVLKHWSKQIVDILEPDALSQAIYRMNNINYLALAVSNIERSRRLRISESSNNINNAIIEQLIGAAEKYWRQAEDIGNLSPLYPLYFCDNKYLGVVIQLQRILSLSRTSNHKQTIGDSTKLKSKLRGLIKDNPNDSYLDIVKWWTLYVMYRSKMTTNKERSAKKIKDKMKGLEVKDKTKYLASLFKEIPDGYLNEKSDSVLRNILRELKKYHDAREMELKWKRDEKNTLNRKRDLKTQDILQERKMAWKKNYQKHTTILYSVIHSGGKENSSKRRFLNTPSGGFSYPHKKVNRIKRQISSVYEAIEIICSRDHHLAPMQMLFLLHDFMYRMEDEFCILSTKKRRKRHPSLWDIRDWLENSCCNMLIGVLEKFKIEIVNPRIGLPYNKLDKAITFWISELKKVDNVNKGNIEKSEKERIKIKCKGIADIFCTAVYGDENMKTREWNIPIGLALYHNKEGAGVSKCFNIIGPVRRLAGEAPLKTPD